jgi:phospholipid/cholesterol/gamma-HCH transport system substrate-binding protein
MRGHPYKLYGVVLLAVAAGLVWLSVLAFKQTFTPATHVTVHVHRAALQLLPGSDVKVRGIIIGSIRDITSTGDGADITMRLSPSQARKLPTNVTVRMLPKTLFGEKYVDLVLPAQPSPQHLSDGAVIAEDQTRTTLEIDQALNDLLPVIRAVPPAELNHTLTALATALSGRGEQLGQTIEQLNTYLVGFDPQLPRLRHDMSALAGVARTYTQAADPLLRMLRNLTVTSNTVVDERQQLSAFLDEVTGAANQTHDLLARNADNLIAVNRVNRRGIGLLARYSPEFPCFVKGYAGLVPRIHNAVPKTPGLNHAAHVVVEFVPSYPTYSNPIDLPQFKDKRGPHCYGLPHPPLRLPVKHYKDGTQDDPRFATQGVIGGPPPNATTRGGAPTASAGTAEDRNALNSILGPVYGINSLSVPDIADLLWGPIAHGSTVNLW